MQVGSLEQGSTCHLGNVENLEGGEPSAAQIQRARALLEIHRDAPIIAQKQRLNHLS